MNEQTDLTLVPTLCVGTPLFRRSASGLVSWATAYCSFPRRAWEREPCPAAASIPAARFLPAKVAIWAAVLLSAVGGRGHASALDQADAVKLSRDYLASRDKADRARLATELNRYEGDIQPVIEELRTRTYPLATPGYHPAEHFSADNLRQRHPDDLLYFVVPETYRPERPTGLIIFMHGGSRGTPRKEVDLYMNFPAKPGTDKTDKEHRMWLGDQFAATGLIAVGPSAPWDEKTTCRWCVRESDDYLADVVRECEARFHIDPDRVFLMGHSMGGYGAFHHIQRQPDRFAAVIASHGAWWLAYWPVIRGTPLCIVHGVLDARKGIRWHFTDIEYARWTKKLLTQENLDFTYLEHDGGHFLYRARDKYAEFYKSLPNLRRDPYFPHIVLASPVGFRENLCFPVKHNRWLTLDETVEGTLDYDELIVHGTKDQDFDLWRLEYRKVKRPGAAIEAINRGDNTIAATTQNVARFTVWLHPKMVDVTKPVTILVNGRKGFEGKVKPSLATALESYQRREDWGLVYPIKIELTVGKANGRE
jgi:pimeloyl-ACP methyl ester carboxylesterase